MAEAPKRSSKGKIIAVLILLLVTAGVVAAFVPLAECPACEGAGTLKIVHDNKKGGLIGSTLNSCPHCTGGRVPILKTLSIPKIDKSLLPELPR